MLSVLLCAMSLLLIIKKTWRTELYDLIYLLDYAENKCKMGKERQIKLEEKENIKLNHEHDKRNFESYDCIEAVQYEIRTQLKAENLMEMAKEQNGLLHVLNRRLEDYKIGKLVTNVKIQASKC
jgi:hypothetical protein